MSGSPLSPPADLPDDVVTLLDEYSADRLQQVAEYAEALAATRDPDTQRTEQDTDEQREDRPDDLPDDVPTSATLTTKEINDNRYYYWQWRDGEQIKSKYKCPVNPDE